MHPCMFGEVYVILFVQVIHMSLAKTERERERWRECEGVWLTVCVNSCISIGSDIDEHAYVCGSYRCLQYS